MYMQYVALLRGINVGGNHKIEMKRLRKIFEALGYMNISTYLNSGNVVFETNKKSILRDVSSALEKEFGFGIPILIKTIDEMKLISESIPKAWKNDTEQRTDVAYLFNEIDSKETVNEIPVKREYIDIRYTKGAIFWNVKRENVYKSQLGKLIGHKLYKFMTIRNINTARALGKDNKL
jgi:uncharacterized protein (DUF1697 family)